MQDLAKNFLPSITVYWTADLYAAVIDSSGVPDDKTISAIKKSLPRATTKQVCGVIVSVCCGIYANPDPAKTSFVYGMAYVVTSPELVCGWLPFRFEDDFKWKEGKSYTAKGNVVVGIKIKKLYRPPDDKFVIMNHQIAVDSVREKVQEFLAKAMS